MFAQTQNKKKPNGKMTNESNIYVRVLMHSSLAYARARLCICPHTREYRLFDSTLLTFGKDEWVNETNWLNKYNELATSNLFLCFVWRNVCWMLDTRCVLCAVCDRFEYVIRCDDAHTSLSIAHTYPAIFVYDISARGKIIIYERARLVRLFLTFGGFAEHFHWPK